jgi:hypothetical protein
MAAQPREPAKTDVTFTGHANPTDGDMTLWFRRPAERWDTAFPIGNGRLGAMVFGHVPRERLQLNEESLWAGGPRDVGLLFPPTRRCTTRRPVV